MGLRLTPAARTALRAFRGHPRTTRTHVLVRWCSAPLTAVADAVPAAGRVLDLGCGHGLLSLVLAAGSPGREVLGVDVDAAKIAEAQRAAATLDEAVPVRFEAVQGGWQPAPGDGWDAIVICDVLYLLGREVALDLLRACAAALAPGGVLVVKEIDQRPAWKYRLARVQELAATRVAKVTQGEVVRFVDVAGMTEVLGSAGLTVRTQRVDRGYPHPHLLLTGRRP